MKSMSLSVKLIGGYMIIAIITLVVGAAGWYGTSRLSGDLEGVHADILPGFTSLLTIKRDFESIRAAQRTLLDPKLSQDERHHQYESIERALESIRKARAVHESLEHSPEETALWRQVVPALEAWMRDGDAFLQLSRELDKTGVTDPTALRADLERFTGDHYQRMSQIANLMLLQDEMQGGDDHTHCAFGKWLATFKTDNARINEALKGMAVSHAAFHLGIKKIKGLAGRGDVKGASAVYTQEMIPAANRTFELFRVLRDQAASAEDLYRKQYETALVHISAKQEEAVRLLDEIIGRNEQEVAESRKESLADEGRTKFIALAGMGMGFLAAVTLGIVSAFSITRPVSRVIEVLTEGARQVAAASGQVASASQHLAEGASQQAAAIEETSSSITEMSSMTGQNAARADEMIALMAETSRVVDEAASSMKHLHDSMRDVSAASEETFQIIKTIDQIAFQTNLLALNAAVEAARAGASGAGFAVVADEVRNLALRTTEAATHTTLLIEGTVAKIRSGATLMSTALDAFGKVAGSSQKVGNLIDEINAASHEQARGIQQISDAVAEMEKVTRQNAAGAEESASASEEMNAQAEQIGESVDRLMSLVHGARNEKVRLGVLKIVPSDLSSPSGMIAGTIEGIPVAIEQS